MPQEHRIGISFAFIKILVDKNKRKRKQIKTGNKLRRKTKRHARRTAAIKPKGGGKPREDFTHYYGWQVGLKYLDDEVNIPSFDIELPARETEDFSWYDKFEQHEINPPLPPMITWNGRPTNAGVLQFTQDVFGDNSSNIRNDDPTIYANFSALVNFARANSNFIVQIVISTPYLRGQSGSYIVNPNTIAARPNSLRNQLRVWFGTIPANINVNIQYSTSQVRLNKGTSVIIR